MTAETESLCDTNSRKRKIKGIIWKKEEIQTLEYLFGREWYRVDIPDEVDIAIG